MNTELLQRCVSGEALEAGLDEAGRGCLAGPVVAAAVILPPEFDLSGLNDSKKLSAKRREELRQRIEQQAVWCVSWASAQEIDELNILQASLLAMRRAVEGLRERPCRLAVDGNRWHDCGIPFTTVVGGDARFANIAAASILAKTHRDAFMTALDAELPGYGFARHKGYPTKEHYEALRQLGVTAQHRRTFRLG